MNLIDGTVKGSYQFNPLAPELNAQLVIDSLQNSWMPSLKSTAALHYPSSACLHGSQNEDYLSVESLSQYASRAP